MNKKLYSLYSSLNLEEAVNSYNKSVTDKAKKAAYPLFLKTSEAYEKADIKLMIFGQETNGWIDFYDSDVDKTMNGYDDFFNTQGHYKYGKQFFNAVKFFTTTSLPKQQEKQKKQNVSIGCLWNNIVKMGYASSKGFPYGMYDSVVKPHLNGLIQSEIKIVKPDYIVFFTGPNKHEEVLNDVFNKPERKKVKGFTERELCEIVIPGVKKAFRTYHPNYLYRTRRFYEFIGEMADEMVFPK